MAHLDVNSIKKDFPIFDRFFSEVSLTYIDNSAASQKPKCVIDAVSDFYSKYNANIHRGLYELSEEATEMYEKVRVDVAKFINARSPEEIIFTHGATSALNTVAFGWGLRKFKKGDVILTTVAEHHSNLVAWQEAVQLTGASIEFIDVNETGEISLTDVKNKMSEKVAVVTIMHASNVLGTIFPVKGICELAHEVGAIAVVDGAAMAGHVPINVQNLGCDFYAFSGHKMLGPTGIGILWGKKELLEKMEPFQFGGGMIKEVTLEKATWRNPPAKFEAGTPNIAGVAGLGAAVDYLAKLGMENVREHDIELTAYALIELSKIERVRILGPTDAQKKVGLVSFTVNGAHAHDVAAVLAQEQVCVRAGHHCAMPLHTRFKIPATVRASFYIYNNRDDVDRLAAALRKAVELLL